ncbi:MAG: alpha/beta fold hydrolase [Acidimicrobiales bacterium]
MNEKPTGTTFLLVHGAWGGSWGFHKLRPLLNAAGHRVFTPSLTGIGERQHLATPEVGLSTHITDVVNTAHYEDLHNIVLLGFSYGGMVVTGALEKLADRVDHLVYLDAFVPSDGESANSIAGGNLTPASADEWTIPPRPRQLGDAAETQWANERRSPQPIKTFTEPVHLAAPLESHRFTRTYIKATADENEPSNSPFWQAAAMAKSSADWQYHEVACNHMIPLMKPAELAEVLLDRVR